MIRFEEPLFFLLLLLLPVAWPAARRAGQPGIWFSSLAIISRPPWWKAPLSSLPKAGMLLVFVLVVVALANPLTRDTAVTEHEYGYRIPLVFDVSYSMISPRSRLEYAKEGAVEFVGSRGDEDIIALIPFATRIHMEHGTLFTSDTEFLAERIEHLRALGLTAMGDAVLYAAVMILAEIHHLEDLGRLGVPAPSYSAYHSYLSTRDDQERQAFMEGLAFYYRGLIEGSFVLVVTDAVGEMNAGIDWDKAVRFIVALDIPLHIISVEEEMGQAIREVLDEEGIEFFHVQDAQDVAVVYRQISAENPTLVRTVRQEVSKSLRPELALLAGILSALVFLAYATFITYHRKEG
jgi:hypothetical protein